jgi:hypothetical protein
MSAFDSDVSGDGSITFDRLEAHVKRAFNFPPLNPNLGPGYLGHFAFCKLGAACVCRSTTESKSTMNEVVVECLDFWDQIDIVVYLIRTTHGKEYYCTRFVLDEAIKKFNKYREVRFANANMYKALRLLS